MKIYTCYLVVGNNTQIKEVIADTVNSDSPYATKFLKTITKIGDYGSPEVGYELVAQYPTDKLVISSVEEQK